MSPAEKQHFRKVAFCPHCRNEAPQHMLHYHSGSHFRKIHRCPVKTGYEEWFLACCESCGAIIIYARDDWKSLAVSHFLCADNLLIYPQMDGLPKSVPPAIDSLYREADSIRRKSPTAFSILLRKALEVVCDDQKAKGKSLFQKLESLKNSVGLPEIISEHADLIRLLGNIGAHADSATVTSHTASAIDELFKVLIDFIYVTPSRLKRIKDELHKTEQGAAANP